MEAERRRDRRARELLEEAASIFAEMGNREKARRASLLLESLSP
jgi:hypothetical protein